MALTRIVYIVLDTEKAIIYKADGTKIEIKQGDVRLQRIIDESKKPLAETGYAEVNLNYGAGDDNHYLETEKKSSGVMRFFRVAKAAVKKFFDRETDAQHVEPVVLGSGAAIIENGVTVASAPNPTALDPNVSATNEEVIAQAKPLELNDPAPIVETKPETKAASTPDKIQDATKNEKVGLNKAIDDIMSQAKPVSDEDFSVHDHNAEEQTMIAVVDTPNGPAVIPGIEHLDNHMRVAAKLGSTVGIENFLKRLGAVIHERGHSVQELLNFMSRGDLPIADDGCIVGYKVLRSTKKDNSYGYAGDPMPVPPKGYYVDCHSGRVLQRVGSYVSQKYVDPNRRNQCSTGLHIARRQYLRGFSGDIITLVKIAPEDVIAVPEREPDKMRARGYHIIAEIPADEHTRLRNNQPIEGMVAKQMLGMALRGQHIGIIEDVIIGGTKGTGLEVIPRKDVQQATAPVITKNAPVAEPLPEPEKVIEKAAVDTKAVAEEVMQTKVAAVPAAPKQAKQAIPSPRADRIKTLLEILRGKDNSNIKVDAARELVQIGKSAKQSLKRLGLSDADMVLVDQFKQMEPVALPTKEKLPPKPKKNAAKGESPAAKEVQATHDKTKSTRENIQDLAASANKGDRSAYTQLLAAKKQAKKSWTALGVINFEAIQAKFEK